MKLSAGRATVLRILLAVLSMTSALPASAAPGRVVLARFVVTDAALAPEPQLPQSLVLYLKDGNVEGERVVGQDLKTIGLSSFESERLMRRLEKLNLPVMDYQKYFAKLAKQPHKPGKEEVIAGDGQEVEVEINVKATKIHFKMWNPDVFLYNHDDDKIASSVNAAVEAIIVSMGRSSVYF